MPTFVETHPGLIFSALVIGLCIYSCTGGLKAFCSWRGIDSDSQTVRRWILSISLVSLILLAVAISMFSGLFLNLLGIAGIFAFAYLAVKLLMAGLVKLGKDIRRM